MELQRSLHSGPIDRSRFVWPTACPALLMPLFCGAPFLPPSVPKVGVFLSAQGDGVTGCRWLALHHRLIARQRRFIKRWATSNVVC